MLKKVLKSLLCIFILSTNLYSKDLKKIAFTFDDGPRPKITEEILDVLKENNAKATFFILGYNGKKNMKVLKRIKDEGHTIANHSYSHPNFSKLSMKDIKKELQLTQDIIFEVTGEKGKYFRPPYGVLNKKQKQELKKDMGLESVMWNLCPEDWKKTSDVAYIQDYLLKSSKENGVVLLHDNLKNLEAIKKVIPILKEQGYDFVGIDEIKK